MKMKKSVSKQRVDCTSTKFNYPLIRVDIRLKMGYLLSEKKVKTIYKNKRERKNCCWCLASLFSVLFSDFASLKSTTQNAIHILNDHTIVVYWNTHNVAQKLPLLFFISHCRFYHHRSHFTSLHCTSCLPISYPCSLYVCVTVLLPCTFVRVCLLSSLVYN